MSYAIEAAAAATAARRAVIQRLRSGEGVAAGDVLTVRAAIAAATTFKPPSAAGTEATGKSDFKVAAGGHHGGPTPANRLLHHLGSSSNMLSDLATLVPSSTVGVMPPAAGPDGLGWMYRGTLPTGLLGGGGAGAGEHHPDLSALPPSPPPLPPRIMSVAALNAAQAVLLPPPPPPSSPSPPTGEAAGGAPAAGTTPGAVVAAKEATPSPLRSPGPVPMKAKAAVAPGKGNTSARHHSAASQRSGSGAGGDVSPALASPPHQGGGSGSRPSSATSMGPPDAFSLSVAAAEAAAAEKRAAEKVAAAARAAAAAELEGISASRLCGQLAHGWASAVRAYGSSMRGTLCALRGLEAGSVAHWAGLRRHFAQFLSRPCPELTLPLRHYQHHHNHVGTAMPPGPGQQLQLPFAAATATEAHPVDLTLATVAGGTGGVRGDPQVQASAKKSAVVWCLD